MNQPEILQGFILVRLIDSPLDSLQNNILDWRTLLDKSISNYDLDNFSDQVTLGYGQEFVRKSDSVLLLVDASASSDLGKCTSFFNTLLKQRSKITSVLIGEHSLASKLLKKLGQQGFEQFPTQEMAKQWLLTSAFGSAKTD